MAGSAAGETSRAGAPVASAADASPAAPARLSEDEAADDDDNGTPVLLDAGGDCFTGGNEDGASSEAED